MAALRRWQAWILAARVRTLTAMAAPILVGLGLALAAGRFRPLPAVATLLAGLLIQVGTNIANDYFDHLKGADTPDRAGGVRVTQAGLLPAESVRRGIWVTFGLALLVGTYLAAVGGWPIVIIGLASIAAGVAYTAGPVPIGYVGLGDLFTFVFFGPVAVTGTYYLQTGAAGAPAVLAGIGVGAVVTAILVVNNLRDLPTDARAGKRTLAVRIGTHATRFEYVMLLALGAVVPMAGWAAGAWRGTAALAVAAFVIAAGPVRTVFGFRDPRELNAALSGTAQLVGAYGLLFATGLAL